jgi:hypothetical protein
MGIWQRLTGVKQDGPAPPPISQTSAKQSKTSVDDEATVTKTKENMQMPDDLITSDNLSPELLKAVFDAAFMEAKLDDDGEIIVQDAVKVRLKVNQERKDRIRFVSLFGFKSDSSQLARLQCANQINAEYIMVCASAEEDLLFFRYDLMVAGGVTKKALVMAVKRFATIPQGAVAEHGKDIVE